MRRDIVVVGASAGGVEALRHLVSRLPGDLPASVFVVLHVPATGGSQLPAILSRSGPLPAVHPSDGMAIESGRIYVAPPDHHLLVQPDVMRVVRGPRENRQRPVIDALFRSAAWAYGPRVVGVLMSGMLYDGTAGLRAIKHRDGISLVQAPDDALFPSMPLHAIAGDHVDAQLTAGALAERVSELAREPLSESIDPPDESMIQEVKIMTTGVSESAAVELSEMPTGFGCPQCGGALRELREDRNFRFRCRVGHAFSAESLLLSQGDALEEALWAALRALEEQVDLAWRLAGMAREWQQQAAAQRYDERADKAERQAATIKQLLTGEPLPPLVSHP